MKNYRLNLSLLELIDLKFALAEAIRMNVRIDKQLGVKFGYYNEDKRLAKLYKTICKKINE